mgnify:CR=1 FL=1
MIGFGTRTPVERTMDHPAESENRISSSGSRSVCLGERMTPRARPPTEKRWMSNGTRAT